MKERNIFLMIVGLFLVFYFMPVDNIIFGNVIFNVFFNGFKLLNEYASKHVLTCLVPAFFIAGAITVFVKKDEVLKYLGNNTKKYISYSIASLSGAILAVCSCTILPLFAGIRNRGAGLGPAITFLFAGPAINIAAMFLTMSVLGIEIGLARIFFSIIISILVGLSMAFIFKEKSGEGELFLQKSKKAKISKGLLLSFFFSMIMVLVVNGLQIDIMLKYGLMMFFILTTAFIAFFKFKRETSKEWIFETWNFSKMILPLLFIGVFIAGVVMPLLPQEFIESIVGQNTIFGNFVASIFGAFMYFSTLTEIPILQALIAKGMSAGPALALLLAGPSLSLPKMIVLRGILGTKKTAVYIGLVVLYATTAGLIFGSL